MSKIPVKWTIFGTLLYMLITLCSGTDFTVDVQNDGRYAVVVDGKTWLSSDLTFMNKDGVSWIVDDAKYELVTLNISSVSNDLWNETRMLYSYGYYAKYVMTSIKVYKQETKVIFTQKYVTAAGNTSLGGVRSFNTTIGGFPCFRVIDPEEDLGFLSYGGYMFGDTDKTTGRFGRQTTNINDGSNYGPLALFNRDGKALVISPYDNYMAASLWFDSTSGHIAWGIMGGVNDIPAGFTYRTILQFSDSINKAFGDWGDSLRAEAGSDNARKREENIKKDLTLHYLGYWTDNGAYYYYHTEPNDTYERTLIDVQFYAASAGIPYQYMQLDSWWYPKDQYKAVTRWEAMPDIFPHGLKNLSVSTGFQFTAHNRYWSKLTPYAKQNGGKFDFVIGQLGSLPNDIEFWRYLLKQARDWGLIVYEQDWLNVQTMYLEDLQTSLTLGRDWLHQMGQAAAGNNLTIQYCMAQARHALQSLEIPTVTQGRVSDDYLYLRPDQWKIGVTSIFAHALNIRPYKDTWWTTSDQPGNPYDKRTEHPALEAVVSSLSRGPVGPGDMIGGTNKTLLMRCCRNDGLLLRPSRPALAVDKQLITDAFSPPTSRKIGEVWSSYSNIPGSTAGSFTQYGIMFAADISRTFSVSVKDLHFDSLEQGVYFPYNDITRWKYFNSSTTIDVSGCTKADFCLFYFSPTLQGSQIQALLGEDSKWIMMSPDRVQQAKVSKETVSVILAGIQEEVKFWYLQNGELHSQICLIGNNPTECVLQATTQFADPLHSVATLSRSDVDVHVILLFVLLFSRK